MWLLSKDQQLITRYRPMKLDEVWGNSHIVRYFTVKLENKATMPRNMFFYGNAGCCKTTFAMIMGKELGCEPRIYKEDGKDRMVLAGFTHYSSWDYNERWEAIVAHMSGNIKNRRSCIFGSPILIYLLDEAHTMPRKMKDSLLHILEYPVTDCFLMFCATDMEQFRDDEAFKSRVAMFNVLPLDERTRIDYIKWICKKERKELSREVIRTIAEESRGRPREILQRLDTAFIECSY